MLNKDEVNRFGPPGNSLAQKEKDYVQHWVLSYLSRAGFEGIFKGGTCLQKAFGLPRYSEDLDFSIQEQNLAKDSLIGFLASAGFGGVKVQENAGRESVTIKLTYQGPLYVGKKLSEGVVGLEFSKREKVLLQAVPTLITPPYPDLLPYTLLVMDLCEMAAEKIRAVITRHSARDLFDLYFIFRRGSVPEKRWVDEKLSYYKKTFHLKEFEHKAAALENIWKTEMGTLLPNAPDFKPIYESVIGHAGKIR